MKMIRIPDRSRGRSRRRFGVGYRCYLKLGARYYNPTTGRFTQPDPSGQEANNYSYASCNPANYTDPTGLIRWDCFSGWFGLTTGVTAFGAGVLAAPLTVGQSGWLAVAGVGTIIAGVDILKDGCF